MKQLDAFTGPQNVEIPFIDEGSEDEVSPDMDLTSEISDDLTIHDVKVVAYSKSEKVLIDNLLQHYRELKLFGVRFTWLCIHKLYRVTLVACNTFVTEPIYRVSLMTSVLMIITIVNAFVKPYNDKKANLTATFSYAANLCLAVLNMWKTALVTFDCKVNCSFQTSVLMYFDIAEKILLTYIPFVFIGSWIVFTIIQKRCR